MRIPSSVFAVGRYGLAFTLAAGSLLLMSAPKKTGFTKYDKAFYADPNTVSFVRPGLGISIVSAKIASDGTMSVGYKLSDPNGQPLDLTGVQTPGAISVSFVMAYLPKGQRQYVSYTTRTQTSPITKVSAVQAGADSGGTTQTVSLGEYVYTFKQKATPPAGNYDGSASHRVGVYGNRNLTEFDLGTDYDSATYDFVPAGGTPQPREVIKNATCNKCHDDMAFHGGSRRGMELCIVCHTPQTVDPDTGNTLDMVAFAHKLHMGSQLPSVKAGKPYQIIGFNQAVSDYSTVNLPSDARRCEFCHESSTKAAQADAWLKNPSRAACGACHDTTNFATGQNHVNLPQVNDSQCNQCHLPQGELEFDASIMGAHAIPTRTETAPGLNFNIIRIDNGVAGKAPTVTFSIKDNAGNGLRIADLTGGLNRIGLVLAGPTSDYGYTSFGSDVTTHGYVSETPSTSTSCSSDGTCSYTFTHAIPAGARGTFAIGLEGRRQVVLLPGTEQEQTTEVGAVNKVAYFSVDGSKVAPRRQVVDIAKCNNCHSFLSLHGENRNQIEQCVLCHNASETDIGRRSTATVAADKSAPAQSVNFALMIHKIHTGEKMTADFNTTYTIVGFGGSHNDFTEVRYPVMTPTGGVGDTAKCYMCHVNNSEVAFPIGLNAVADPQGLLNPAPATTSACTACHQNKTALAHANAQTDPKFGESCGVCHGAGADADVQKAHAGK
jgi:OmcA/MtrC family decaheme c-type cytochrome